VIEGEVGRAHGSIRGTADYLEKMGPEPEARNQPGEYSQRGEWRPGAVSQTGWRVGVLLTKRSVIN
jgi:hypothetical protein